MKTRKLKFKKEIVANLSNAESNQIRGREGTSDIYCSNFECIGDTVCCASVVSCLCNHTLAVTCYCGGDTNNCPTGGWATDCTVCCTSPTYVECTHACC